MKPVDCDGADARCEEVATEWLLEREDGFTPERAEAFRRWCAEDPRHVAAVARVEQTMALLDELPSQQSALEQRLAQAGPSGRRRLRRWTVSAGMAAAIAVAGWAWWSMPSAGTEPQSYAASDDAPKRISLSDGTVVDLNANSRLQVQFTKGERDVVLLAGEAHFQVAHNAARPFVVTAHGVAVRAVGTAFDVHLAGSEVDVLVSEGKVKIDREERSAFFRKRITPVIPLLVAGERMAVVPSARSVAHVEKVPPAQMRALLAWQDRMTSFDDVPLREMVSRFNRCNSVQLVIDDPQLGDRRVGGVIDLTNIESFVHLLEQDGDVASERTSPGTIVLHRAH